MTPRLMDPYGCLKAELASPFLLPSLLGRKQPVTKRSLGSVGFRHLTQIPEIWKSTPLHEEQSSPHSVGLNKGSGSWEQGVGRVDQQKVVK